LGSLVERASSVDPARAYGDAEFDYVDLGSVDRVNKRVTGAMRVSGLAAPGRARQLLAHEDVLVSTVRPNLNAVAVVERDLDGAVGSTGFTVLRARECVDARYLFHWVRGRRFIDDMVRRATGASYPAISDRTVLASCIPLPPLDEQRRIAQVLDAASGLRGLRCVVSARAATLATSTYKAVFSDVDLAVAQVPLGSVADVGSGITKGRKASADLTYEVPYLAVSNVQDGRLDLSRVKTIEASAAEVARYRLLDGDLLLTEGGDPDKLGRGTLWSGELDDCIHQNHVFRVRVHDRSILDPVYLRAHLSTQRARAYFLRLAKQTTGIASINKSQLAAFPVTIPAPELQARYVRAAAQTAQVVSRQQQHLQLLNALFASIQHRAFTGTL